MSSSFYLLHHKKTRLFFDLYKSQTVHPHPQSSNQTKIIVRQTFFYLLISEFQLYYLFGLIHGFKEVM